MQNSQIMLIKAKRAIQQLQEQLSEVIKTNQQHKELIQILTEEKNFYMTKYHQQQAQFHRVRTQIDKKNSLITNLSQQNKHVAQENIELQKQLAERDFLLEAQDKQMQRMRSQKNILENQWNRIVKSVKGKLYALQFKQQSASKKKIPSNFNKRQKSQEKNCQPKIDKSSRVRNIIKQINFKLAHDQIESILKLKNQMPQKQNDPYYFNAQKLKFDDLTQQQKAM